MRGKTTQTLFVNVYLQKYVLMHRQNAFSTVCNKESVAQSYETGTQALAET